MERFWSAVSIGTPTQCWTWLKAKNRHGYGMFWTDRRMKLAHRVAYTLRTGSIPKGLCILHRCDNPACVNPNHLFLGTQIDNIRDCVSKDRHKKGTAGLRCGDAARGALNPMAKLTQEQVSAIRLDRRPQREVAEMHGVSQSTISLICCWKRWTS